MVMRPRASAPCPSLLPLPGSTPLEELSAEARLKVAPGSGPSKKVAIEGTPSVTLEEEVAIEPLWLVVIAEIPPRIKEVIADHDGDSKFAHIRFSIGDGESQWEVFDWLDNT